jgi:hypothetical protein
MYLSYDEDMTRGKENLRRSPRLLLLLHHLLQTVGLPVTLRRPSNNAPSNTPSGGYRKYCAHDKNAAPHTHLLPLKIALPKRRK